MQKYYLLSVMALILSGCITAGSVIPPAKQTPGVKTTPNVPLPACGSNVTNIMEEFDNKVPTSLNVELQPKFGGQKLQLNDQFDIDLRASEDAYVHLYLFQTSCNVTALIENYQIKGNKWISFPQPVNAGYALTAKAPKGINTILMLATKLPIAGTVSPHNGAYLKMPANIVSTQGGAIAEIKNQLRTIPTGNWQATARVITVY